MDRIANGGYNSASIRVRTLEGATLSSLEPPVNPGIEDQRDALRKGLGRAALWAQEGRLDFELLHAACLNDWRYDKQFDDNRATYLWSLLSLTNSTDELHVPVLDALGRADDSENAYQIFGLAFQYASRGYADHRQAIYDNFARLLQLEQDWIPDGYRIGLDGIAGFQFCLEKRAAALRSRDWTWGDDALISTAAEEFGSDWVERFLDESRDSDIIRFRDRWRLEQHNDQSTRSVELREPVESLDEVMTWQFERRRFDNWNRESATKLLWNCCVTTPNREIATA